MMCPLSERALEEVISEFRWLWRLNTSWSSANADIKIFSGEKLLEPEIKGMEFNREAKIWVATKNGLSHSFLEVHVRKANVLGDCYPELFRSCDLGWDVLAVAVSHDANYPLLQCHSVEIFRPPKKSTFAVLLSKIVPQRNIE